MPTFGVHAFVWGPWNDSTAESSIKRSAEAGYDLIEIPLLRPTELDTAAISGYLREAGIGCTTSLALPADAHMPSHPDRALAFLKTSVDVAVTTNRETK